MKNKLLIIGAGGHGKVVADIAMNMGKWENISFLDDSKHIKESLGLKVIGRSKEAINYIDEYDIFIAVGNNYIRKQLHEKLEKAGATIPVLVHPSATIGKEVDIESGTVVMAGAVINCSTKISKSCIINTSASIDHDCKIGSNVHISPGANLAGNVTIGKNTWIGIGSVISNNIYVTEDCKLGAGAVVIESISIPGTYVGIPARRIK
jgi:sugar O-acyltransferase (sialic acid O-acetyltransferase NeuD family)